MSTASLCKQYQIADAKRMAFYERGDGDASVFLHVIRARRTYGAR